MRLLSDLVGMGQLITASALFVRGRNLPKLMTKNKIGSVAIIWFGGSVVRSTLTKTGAFEVYHGQKLVWSSVQKHVPEMKELIASFKSAGVEISS
mmetsp:Transcript_18711/g.30338  ORF Transcript_18711/g.30338 Transcript_18711/m.30338 type:complete len:95 (-) Transcript_18711:257-541(-)